MNTVRSVGYGWGVLMAAGGGAYYFAKRSINADREQRHNSEMERAALQRQYEDASYERSYKKSSQPSTVPAGQDNSAVPNRDASAGSAPTRNVPDTDEQRASEKSRFEASQVWRSKKGDRLS